MNSAYGLRQTEETIRRSEAQGILGVSRGTFEKWVREGIIHVAKRLPVATNNHLPGERRFYLKEILALEKEMRSSLK